LTCFAAAASRTDKNGDLPLTIAIKSECNQSVVNYLLMQYPDAAKVLDSSGHTNLHLALQHGADDRTMLGLLNHAPEVRLFAFAFTSCPHTRISNTHYFGLLT